MADEQQVHYPNKVRIPFLNEITQRVEIYAGDHSPNKGGGRHHYKIRCFNVADEVEFETTIDFQEGALTTGPFNGVLSIALLAILKDHIESFQEGEFKCRETALVVTKLDEAIHWQAARADERKSRGVLGAHAK